MRLQRRTTVGGSGPSPVELPGINMLVRLVPPAPPGGVRVDEGFSSRVEDVVTADGGPSRFLVVAPQYPGDLLDRDPAATWWLTWVSDRGRWEVPTRCEDAVPVEDQVRTPGRRTGPRALWLTPIGSPRRNQRRRFYRAAWPGRVELDLLAEPFATLAGRALDLSEGGLRCLLPVAGLEPGTAVLVRLRSAPGRYDPWRTDAAGWAVTDPLAGVVRRSHRPARPARIAGWFSEVALAFDDPDRYGDELRRFVVRLQLRSRRLAPPGRG